MATMNGLRQYMAAVIIVAGMEKMGKRYYSVKKNDLLFILSILLMASFINLF